MQIYLKNNPAKFHPDPIWSDKALAFFEDGRPSGTRKEKKNSSNKWSIPDPKILQKAMTYKL